MRPNLLDILSERVVVFDGAMGTSLQARHLPLSDYDGHENCVDVLVLTRPDVVADVHRSFLDAGCDVVETNTFGANKVVLGEFGLSERTREMNRRAAEIARHCADAYSTPSQPRFVAGSIGPGTKLPSLRQVTWEILEDSYAEQVRGLIEGGVDALIIETCQDILQAKAAVCGAVAAMEEKGVSLPLLVQVTMETTGTMLVGTDIQAAMVALLAYPQVSTIGLNCATGPQEMSEHVRFLGQACPRPISVQPNAGLPVMVEGEPQYPLTPEELARWLREFVEQDGVGIVGGCCGTTPAHLAAVVKAVRGLVPRPRPARYDPHVSSLYQAVALRQESSLLLVGERTNANGSKRFRELLQAGDVDGMVQMAREQVRQGSHVIDVCAAYVGRDERADMEKIVARFATEVTVPLMIDSTEVGVIETSLRLAGGKCIINSINLEDGEEKLDRICRLARKYGAAVVALTIDEEGMAKTAQRKVEVALRIHDLATRRHGLDEGDLLFDPLTFTICTGNEADRRLALETLEAIGQIKARLPNCHTLLGVSNVSFGLRPAARRVLNSVFLHYAREAGLDAAIVHAGGVLPLYRIDEAQREAARRLIFDERTPGRDPLAEFIALFAEADQAERAQRAEPATIEEKLKRRIIDGDRTGLTEDLEEALRTYGPLEIINNILLEGMKVVGDLFGSGQMQLPFVLQSAETMKAAVAYLEPFMERVEGQTKGRIVLATVKGDVHDIGKNLVDIILTNNGYTVYNLGIRQPISNIVAAWKEHRADAIGLSGLLVKSTQVMKNDLEVLNEMGLSPPVILGGAALTRRYVEQDLRRIYRGPLFYAKDAFEGLQLMERIVAGEIGGPAEEPAGEAELSAATAPPSRAERTARLEAFLAGDEDAAGGESVEPQRAAGGSATAVITRSDVSTTVPVPKPPFWGARVVEHVPLRAVLAFLNEVMLFQVQWQYRKAGRDAETFRQFIEREVRPIYRALVETCEREGILQPRAVYGYWPAQSEGNDLIVYDPQEREREVVRFRFPRQTTGRRLCLADFFRPRESGEYDVVAFSVVTVGERASEVAREWFAQNRYRDYLHLHGLSVEAAEALAEYIHKRVRVELGIADRDERDMRRLLQQGYQGSRYSFGYPACPHLEDQEKLLRLVGAERIGVGLTEEFQLVPEQSTTAIICHHPEARYFRA